MTRARLLAAALLLHGCAGVAGSGDDAPHCTTGNCDDVSQTGSELPDPNAAEPPPEDWVPPPLEEWPDTYAIFNNTGCARGCTPDDQAALAARSVMRKMIIAAIHGVKQGGTIRVANFNISSSSPVTPVADALVWAMRERGATVEIAMDQGQDIASSRTNQLGGEGAQVRFVRGLSYTSSTDGSQQFGIMHSKMVVVDDQVVLTGSNNFSASGFVTNEENSVVMTAAAHADRIAAFTCDFDAIFAAGQTTGVAPRADDDPDRAAAVESIDGCDTHDIWFPPAGMLTHGRAYAYDAVTAGIKSAQTSIDIAPDMLAHPGLVSAILYRVRGAQSAGAPVTVRVALDASSEALGNPAFGQCLADAAAAEGLPIEVRYWPGNDAIYQLLHHKMMVIDAAGADPVLYNGSANYSSKALKESFENVTRYQGPEFAGLAADFAARFERVWADSLTPDQLEKEKGVTLPTCPVPGL